MELVTVVGEALIDLVPSADGRSFVAHPGGSPYNVAIGLARLGAPVALMARLGQSPFGQLLRAGARDEGVDLTAAVTASEPTTLAVVSLDAESQASYEFYVVGTADWQWSRAELERLPEATTILHFGSLASWTAPGDERIAELAAQVQTGGRALVSYDPNVRAPLLGDPVRGRRLVERGVALAGLLKASREDAEWLYPGESVDRVAARWLDLGPALVVITDGAAGARAYRAGASPLIRAAAAVEPVDTVGAGDSFMSALLAACAERGVDSQAQLADWGDAEVGAALELAIRASALTCQRAGADPPSAEELAAARSGA